MKHAKENCVKAIEALQLKADLTPIQVLKKLRKGETHIESIHKPLRTLWMDATVQDAQAINTLSLCLFSDLSSKSLRKAIKKGKPDIWVRKGDNSLVNIVDYKQDDRDEQDMEDDLDEE